MKKIILETAITFLFVFTCHSQIIELEPFGPSTFEKPVGMKNAGDSRLFVHEQSGIIKILNANQTVNTTPFLDISSQVNSANFERGLLGLAFHPNYATNGFFYVHYTNLNGDSIISRFTVSPTNPDEADASTELIIMSIPQPYDAHQGGDLNFDSNGYLFIALGDGGAAFDLDDRAQDLNDLLGSMLRIDVDNPSGGNNYGIPPGNPFVETPTDDPNTLAEIWHFGLRNPAKFSFDSATGDMWIADTGQEEWEEIDLNIGNTPAQNYGWPCYEGDHVTDYTDPVATNLGLTYPSYCSGVTNTPPVAEFNHNEPDGVFRCASIGGYRYRGTVNPNLNGVYFYADFCSANIFMLADDGSGGWTETIYDASAAGNFNLWTGFGEDVTGELYIFGQLPANGSQIYKIKQETLNVDSVIKSDFKIIPNPVSNGLVILKFNESTPISSVNAYTIQGQLVKSQTISATSNFAELSVTNWSSGIYIIEVINRQGEKLQKKLIIE